MEKESNKFYITTAIDYANAPLHLGHMLEKVQADVLARYHRLLGENVFFLTGSDENAQKNVLVAREKGVPIEKLVDDNVVLFKKAIEILNISNDDFIRTSNRQRHWPGVKKLWESCIKKGDIYKKEYKGFYCVGCEAFLTEKDLEDDLCPEHLTKPEEVSEENYFFKLSKYQKELERLIEDDKLKVVPEKSKNEVLSFIKSGLDDFSVSRPTERTEGWGVPVPGDEKQIIYVWYDALGNYLSALGYGSGDEKKFAQYWPADIHVIGKGIIRFHAIYWPAILLSAGVELPKTIFVHGYLTINGQKISKSIGNVINPIELIERYGTDPVRYFLLREIPAVEDGDFTIGKFEERYNADLANGLGNLVSRVFSMVEKYCDGKVPKIDKDPDSHPLRGDDKIYNWKKAWKDLDDNLAEFQFNKALSSIWQFISEADRYIEETRPWDLAKEGKSEELNWVLYGLLDAIHQLAWQIYVFLPETAIKIAKALKIKGLLAESPQNKDSWTNIKSGAQLGKLESLFPRLK